jgi:type II secretory pathway pseudopilin PulG
MTRKRQTGFSLLETMISLGILLAVGGIVGAGMVQMMKTQGSIANRTEMHTSVRSATELLQQEIGQAGHITLGSPNGGITLAGLVPGGSQSFTLSYPANTAVPNVYAGEWLTVDAANGLGTSVQETVQLTGGSTNTGTATFTNSHPAGAPVFALGAFATGVVPPDTTALTDPLGQCVPTSVTVGGVSQNYVGFSNPGPGAGIGSTCEILKLYGDINGDGNIVYIEYNCAQGTQAAPGFLYRQQVNFGGAKVSPPPASTILLSNVLKNPNDVNGNLVPCFRYQVQPLGTGWVVTDVAVTLTVQTQNVDPTTHLPQTETKALLNVSPRNVFEVWVTANQVDPTRAQPMPGWISSLL